MDTHFAFGGTVRHGYFPVLESTETHPNAVEAWEFIREDFLLPNEESPEALKYWPDERFEKIFRSYWQHSEKLVLPIMRALLEYLDADISLYDNELSPANILLRLNHYPPVSNLDSSLNSVNRFMAHEDYGLLTFLPSNSIEGLQIFHPQREAWVRLNPPEGTLIVNSGDWLKLISNDRFHSCTHRVSMPQNPDMRTKSRISTPFVILPYESSVIEVIPGQIPKYKPTNGLDFMAGLAGKIVKYDSVKLNQI
jgi:isopenicillin N synthase-like dioxygenase